MIQREVPEKIIGLEKLYRKVKGEKERAYGRADIKVRRETLNKLRKLRTHSQSCTKQVGDVCRRLGCDSYDDVIGRLIEGHENVRN